MSRGLYTVASSMLTQQRKIDVHSNNLANINTAGYKKEQLITSNFGNLLISKVNQDGIYETNEPLGNVSLINTVVDNNTIHSQGALDKTGGKLDFAILGSGFFGVSDENGNTMYTRNGNFDVDEEGYLIFQDKGKVQGEYGDIYIGTDKFTFKEDGSIYVENELIDKMAVFDFENYDNLEKVSEGLYGSNEQSDIVEYPNISRGTIERSNVNSTEEMVEILSSQRALQTGSQVIKMYDKVMEMAANRIGNIN